jgi:hypothetical protein
MVVKEVVEQHSVRAHSGCGERGRRGGGGVVRNGGVGAPFIGSERERGGQIGKGIRRRLRLRLVGFIPGKKEVGRGPRGSERRGWRWAGPARGQGPVGREAGG